MQMAPNSTFNLSSTAKRGPLKGWKIYPRKLRRTGQRDQKWQLIRFKKAARKKKTIATIDVGKRISEIKADVAKN